MCLWHIFYHFTIFYLEKTMNFQPSDHSTLHSPGTTWPSPRSPPAAPPPGRQLRRNGGPTGHTGPRRPRRCRRQRLGPTGRVAPPGCSSNVLRLRMEMMGKNDTRWCPPVISWFIIPLTIDISTISPSCLIWFTLWLFNIATERSTIFKNGKPSISIGHFPWLC